MLGLLPKLKARNDLTAKKDIIASVSDVNLSSFARPKDCVQRYGTCEQAGSCIKESSTRC